LKRSDRADYVRAAQAFAGLNAYCVETLDQITTLATKVEEVIDDEAWKLHKVLEILEEPNSNPTVHQEALAFLKKVGLPVLKRQADQAKS
jgi:hypothetical protein